MDWMQCTFVVLLAYSVATISGSPIPHAAIHVKYFAPAHMYSGAFYSSGAGATGIGRNTLEAGNPEAMWPTGVFQPPDNWLSSLQTQVFPSPRQPFAFAGEDYDDPLLVRGEAAAALVKALLSGGEMFYSRMPHVRALLRVQEVRRLNGLPPLRMGSNRPDSPFYLWADHSPQRTFIRSVRRTR